MQSGKQQAASPAACPARDDPRCGDGIGENELLVVSFGTSRQDSRVAAIQAIEDALAAAFPDYSVRRAFLSAHVIAQIRRQDGLAVDGLEAALDRARANGVRNLLVQSTLLMNGRAYAGLLQTLERRAGDFQTIRTGAPLLATGADCAAVARAMAVGAGRGRGGAAVCFMAHGVSGGSNDICRRMQEALAGYGNCFAGAMEGRPSAEDLLPLVQAGGYRRVVLYPMLIAAGTHARRALGGGAAHSWASIFRAAGYPVETVIRGLGELEDIRQLLVDHARRAPRLPTQR